MVFLLSLAGMLTADEMTTYCLYESNNVGPELALRPAVVDIACGEPERDSTLPCDAAGSISISSSSGSGSNSNSNSSSTDKPPRRTVGFPDLPFEIRLQIYRWLHLLSPVRHAQLAPWYPTPVHSRYVLRRLDAEGNGGGGDRFTPSPGLLSAQRPLSGLPTALLRCSSQIYLEARTLPFASNEFVFVNWFASGLWAARAFTRGLEPWQREAMRFVRLEMLARDVAGGAGSVNPSSSSASSSSSGMDEWRAVCSDWSAGVRGLRMKMVLGVSGTGNGGVMAWGAAAAAAQETDRRAEESPWEAAEEARRRVGEGLGRMRRLERVEMELVTRHLDDGEKVAWCERLQEELRRRGAEQNGEEGGLAGVRVVCTEKVKEKMEWVSRTVGVKHVQAVAAH